MTALPRKRGNSHPRQRFCIGLAATLWACHDPVVTEPASAPATGTLTVAVSTAGLTLDADGYSFEIDHRGARRIGIADSVIIGKLPTGEHAVRLTDTAPNCNAQPNQPVKVSVATDAQRRVSFSVVCDSALRNVILFTRYHFADNGIKVMWVRPDGSDTGMLLDGATDPSVTPDGRRMTFRVWATSQTDIADITGANRTKLLDWWEGTQAAVSSDGHRIAFIGSGFGQQQLYVKDVDGSNLRRLTSSDLSEQSPVWSPDGRQIVIGRAAAQLVVVQSDGSGERMLQGVIALPRYVYDWSQVGGLLYNGGNNIWVTDPFGTTPHPLTGSAADQADQSAKWSPDAREFVFDHQQPAGTGLFIASADGSSKRLLLTTPVGDFDQVSQWIR